MNLLIARDRLPLGVWSVWSERKGLLLRRRQREQEGRRSEWTEVRQARLDTRSIHGEESVMFSGSIGMELDSEGSIVSTCTESNFEDVTSLIHSSVIFLSARSGSLPQCSTFSSIDIDITIAVVRWISQDFYKYQFSEQLDITQIKNSACNVVNTLTSH